MRQKANYEILEGFLSELLHDQIKIHHIIENKSNQKLTPLDEWIYFFKNSEAPNAYSAKGLKQAEETLDEIKLPEGQRYSYDRYCDSVRVKASEALSVTYMEEERNEMKGKLDETRGKLDATEEKLHTSKIEMAKMMLEFGKNTNEIMTETGLTASEIEYIKI